MNVARRKSRALLIFVAMTLLSAACRKAAEQSHPITIELDDKTLTYRTGRDTISLKLTDTLGNPVSGAQVSLEGNMLHAGMAPTFGQASEVAPGNYRGNLDFTMGGDWIITVRVHLSDGQQVERQFEIKGVRSD